MAKEKKENQVKVECKHKKSLYKNYRINVFDNKYKEYFDVFGFLLYDMEQWNHKEIKVNEKLDNDYKEILKSLNITSHVEYGKNAISDYKSVELDEDVLCFECERMCISKDNGENNLSAFLRHLRNSIAHCQVYIKNNEYVLFQDIDEKKNVSARIMIKKQHYII